MDHGRHDFDWEDLLGYIESREVIPIVGKELLTITVDGREAPLERHLAERLAVALGLPTGELSGGFGLNEVAMACAARRRKTRRPGGRASRQGARRDGAPEAPPGHPRLR